MRWTALPADAHDPADVGDRARLVEDAAEDLPPRGGQPAVRGQVLGGLHQPGVQPEGGEDDVGHQRTTFRLPGRLRPVRREVEPSHPTGSGSAAGSARWNTPSYASSFRSSASPSRCSVARANCTGESGPAVIRSPPMTARSST